MQSSANFDSEISNLQSTTKSQKPTQNDEKEESEDIKVVSGNGISWMHIANCVQHEMYPKIANAIRFIIDNNSNLDNDVNIGLYDLDDQHINIMMDILKTKKKLAIEERNYLRKLCERALQFVPISSQNQKQHKRLNDKDFNREYKGLNERTLQDIFDVHRAFRFRDYHFDTYSLSQFRNDIINAGSAYLGEEFVQRFIVGIKFKERMNFHPSYIIVDDIFQIFDHMFSFSQYVHYLRNGLNGKHFKLKVMIIARSVRSVYDENISYKYVMSSISDYLEGKGVYYYHRIPLQSKTIDHTICDEIQHLYDIRTILAGNIKHLILIIDRRKPTDILYVYSFETFHNFKELNADYFIGFDFDLIPINNNNNKVLCYFRYGIHEILRFYPEILISIIPRIFVRSPDVEEATFLDTLYRSPYKHGWSVDLDDDCFNTFYKMMTGITHISVNYNRGLLRGDYSNAKDIIFFRDLLEYEVNAHFMNNTVIALMNECFMEEEYDSESIIDDIALKSDRQTITESNIALYFRSNKMMKQFSKMESIVDKYTDCSQQNKPKSCNVANIVAAKECEHIDIILKALTMFQKDKFAVDINKYNITELLESYDHMIDVHRFCTTPLSSDDESKQPLHIKTYMTNQIGYCTVEDCSVLTKHRMRRREREDINVYTNNEDNSLKEIISATLYGMHCYIQHKRHLFRLEKSRNNLHFITHKDDHEELEEKSESVISIRFGISVLEWLRYREKPQFPSLREEIVNNPNSTINHQLYLNFAQECFIKMIGRKREQYRLEELMSLKIYTDTDAYQSALRKAFWKSSPKPVKASFYQWAQQLYKAALFHAKPTPRFTAKQKGPQKIYHGLNNVFILDDGLPVYNGAISTSLEPSVALSFSQAKGLIWTIQPSYVNKFKFTTGICLDWISHHKNEAEILLVNQYLPIVSTKNFDNDVNNNVHHLLYQLKSYRKVITNPDTFYNIIGLSYNPQWIPILKSNEIVLKPSVLVGKTVLERLIEELKIDIEVFLHPYKLLSNKFQIIPHFAFNYFSIQHIGDKFSNNTEYRMIYTDIKDLKHTIDLECNQLSIYPVGDLNGATSGAEIHIKNTAVFGRDQYIKMQHVPHNIFAHCTNTFHKNLKLHDGKIILLKNKNSIDLNYRQEILKSKYLLLFNDSIALKQIKQEQLNSTHHIHVFDNLQSFHFVIPYKCNLQKIGFYVKFKDDYNFILFKTFHIKKATIMEDTDMNQVNYLLDILNTYQMNKYPVKKPETFFKKINVTIQNQHISIMKNHPLLSINQQTDLDSNKKILYTLIEDLELYELSNVLQKYTKHENTQRDKILQLTKDNNITVQQINQFLQTQHGARKEKQQYNLNETIQLKRGYKGTIKYIGKTHFSNGQIMYGIELAEMVPDGNNGKINNREYFNTKYGYGYFAKKTDFVDQIDEDEQKNAIIDKNSNTTVRLALQSSTESQNVVTNSSMKPQALRRSRTIEELEFQRLDSPDKDNDKHPPFLPSFRRTQSNQRFKPRKAVHFSMQSSANFDSEISNLQSHDKHKSTTKSQKQKPRSCDNMKLDHCSAMQNISYVLGLYQSWTRDRKAFIKKENDGMFDRIHHKNSKIKNRTQLLNDFHHILDEHSRSNRDLETVQKYIQNTCGRCILKKGDKASCSIIARQLRDTTKEQHNHAVKIRHFFGYTDKKEIVTQQILDTIHSFIYHSFDTLRFTVEEQQEIDELNSDNDAHSMSADAIKKAQSIIAKKKKMVGLICKYDPYKANKKYSSEVSNSVTHMDAENDEKHDTVHLKSRSSVVWGMNAFDLNHPVENDTENTTLMSVYSFGKQFIYHTTKDTFASTFHLLIKPRHKDFKDELLNNTIHRVSIANYNDTYEKALVAFDTDKAKNMNRRKDNHYDDIYYGKNKQKSEFINVHHILSIIFYTDYSILCFKFSQTYRRRTSSNEKWSGVARRHSQYYHWGLLLKETVECFGILAKGNSKKLRKRNTFYHGLNQELAFTTFVAQFYGPTSFTDEVSIAQAFAKNDGMVLYLQPHRKYPSLYFDCKWLSMHPYESEKLFIGGQNPLNIYTIITMSHPQLDHRKCLEAMMHISQMIGVESTDIKLKFRTEHKRYVKMLIENELCITVDAELHKYMIDSFHIFCQSVENVFIDLKHILFEKMPKMFKNEDGIPKIELFQQLFPNAQRFNVSAADSSKTHLLRGLSEYMFGDSAVEQLDNGVVCLSPYSTAPDESMEETDQITQELMSLVAVYEDEQQDAIIDMNEEQIEQEIQKLNQWYLNDSKIDEMDDIIIQNEQEKYLEELRAKYIDNHTGLGRPNGHCKTGNKCGWQHVEEDVFPTLTLAQKLHGFFYHNEEYIEYEANARSQKYCETHFKKGIRKSLLISPLNQIIQSPRSSTLPPGLHALELGVISAEHSVSIATPPLLQKHQSSIPCTNEIYDKPDVEYVSTMEEMAPTEYDTLQFGHPWEVDMSDATFGDPKQEILENAFESLEKYHWNDILKQSIRVSEKREARLIGLSLKLVVALKLYTDCDKLQDEFILSYRHEFRTQRIKRQKAFCYWNTLLEESCHRSQDIITDKLYRSVNQQVTTSSFTGTFWGPVSCTTEFVLANAFVGTEGTILEMYPTYARRGLKVHWLSMFPYEKEVIYFSTSFQISHIYYKAGGASQFLNEHDVHGISKGDFMERAILKSLQLINTESNVISFNDINDDSDNDVISSGFNGLDGLEKIAVLYLLYLQYRSNEWKQFWNKLDENIKFAFAKYRDQFIALAMNVREVKMEKLSMWLQDFFCCDQQDYEFPIQGSTKQNVDNARLYAEKQFIAHRALNFGTIIRLFPHAQQLSINGDNFDWTLQSFVVFVDQYQLDYQNIALQDIHIKFEKQYPHNDDVEYNQYMDDEPGRSPSISTTYAPGVRHSYSQISSVSTVEDVEASKRLNKHKDKSRENIHELIKMGWKFLSPSHISRIGFEPLPEMPFVMTFVKNKHMYYRTYSQLLLNKEAFLNMNPSIDSLQIQQSDDSYASEGLGARKSRITTPIPTTQSTLSSNNVSSYYDDEGGFPSTSPNSASAKDKEEKEDVVRDRGSSVAVDYNPINCTLSSQVLSTLSYKQELIEQLMWKKKHLNVSNYKSNNKLKQSFNKYCDMVKALVLDPMPSELYPIFLHKKTASFDAITSVFPNVCDLFLRDTQLKLKECYALKAYLKKNTKCKLERIFFCKEDNRRLHSKQENMVRSILNQLDWDLNVMQQMIFCRTTFISATDVISAN